MFEQKNSQKKNWRNTYENVCRNLIKKAFSDGNAPEKLVLPISVRSIKNGTEKVFTMYEFGGSFGDHGTAMLIGDAFGLPLQGKLLFHPRYNSIQASMTVWPGCVVAIASHQSGKASSAFYKIVRFDDSIDDNGFGRVELSAIKTSEESSIDLTKISNVLLDKLYIPNCVTAHYIEDLVPIRNQNTYRAKFYSGVAGNSEMEWYGAGLADMHSDYESVSCSSFKNMYNNVVSRAYEVQNKNRLVFVAFCNYLVTINDNQMFYIDTNGDIPEDAVMVTDARVMYSPGPMKNDVPMKLDNKVYTFIHSSELSDQRDNPTVEFFKEHSERYIKDVLGNNLPTRMKASLMHYKNFKFAQCSLLITSAADFYYDMKMDRANAAPVHFEAKDNVPFDATINDAFGKIANRTPEDTGDLSTDIMNNI